MEEPTPNNSLTQASNYSREIVRLFLVLVVFMVSGCVTEHYHKVILSYPAGPRAEAGAPNDSVTPAPDKLIAVSRFSDETNRLTIGRDGFLTFYIDKNELQEWFYNALLLELEQAGYTISAATERTPYLSGYILNARCYSKLFICECDITFLAQLQHNDAEVLNRRYAEEDSTSRWYPTKVCFSKSISASLEKALRKMVGDIDKLVSRASEEAIEPGKGQIQ